MFYSLTQGWAKPYRLRQTIPRITHEPAKPRPLAPFSCYRRSRTFSFDFDFSTMGVPRNPNFRRIWLTRYRS